MSYLDVIIDADQIFVCVAQPKSETHVYQLVSIVFVLAKSTWSPSSSSYPSSFSFVATYYGITSL